jgi:hypothetical protein
MRPLTEDESKLVFEKLANYIASTPRTFFRPILVLTLPVQRGKTLCIWWTGRTMCIVFGCTRVASIMSLKPQCGLASRSRGLIWSAWAPASESSVNLGNSNYT